jgi:hypothetical protein
MVPITQACRHRQMRLQGLTRLDGAKSLIDRGARQG